MQRAILKPFLFFHGNRGAVDVASKITHVLPNTNSRSWGGFYLNSSFSTTTSTSTSASPVSTQQSETASLALRRVLLKLSGEALAGKRGSGIDPHVLSYIASEVAKARTQGVEVAVVVGGGNFFRGATALGLPNIDRAQADGVGMLATCMNAIIIQSALEAAGVPSVVLSALDSSRQLVEPYSRTAAREHLAAGRIVVLGGGTGMPFCTTDTAAAQRAAELSADVLLKATKVDGIYSRDPAKLKEGETAERYDTLSYDEVVERRLGVMDASAMVLCRERRIPLVVFDVMKPGAIARAAAGDRAVGTLVTP